MNGQALNNPAALAKYGSLLQQRGLMAPSPLPAPTGYSAPAAQPQPQSPGMQSSQGGYYTSAVMPQNGTPGMQAWLDQQKILNPGTNYPNYYGPSGPSSNSTSPALTSSPTTNSTSTQPFSWSIEDLGALINNPTPATGGIDMVQMSPQTSLQNQFMNTPAYQLQYGNNKAMNPGDRFAADSGTKLQFGNINPADNPFQRFTQDSGTKLRYGNIDPNASPDQRFLSDAGTQLAIQQGMKPLINSFASQGLAQSGALAKALSDYSFNHYNDYMNQQQQSFNQYTGSLGNAFNSQMQNQGNMFNNYQQQLQGLTGLGAANTGNQNALSNQQMLAQLLGQANLSTGNNLANVYMNGGNNISSLLFGQGTNGMGAMLNTGALQNTNYANGLSAALQAYFAQQAGNASAMGGQGAMAGLGGFF